MMKKKTTTKAKAKPKSKAKTKRKATTGKKMKMTSRRKPVTASAKAPQADLPVFDRAVGQKTKKAASSTKSKGGKVVQLRVPSRGGFFAEGESGFKGLEEAGNSTRDQFSDNVTPIHAGVHVKQPPGKDADA